MPMTSDCSPEAPGSAAHDVGWAERLLEGLCAGDLDLRGLSAALAVPLVDLARWVTAASNAALLEGLLRLADARAAMAVCRYRTAAAAVLINIAAQKDDDDRHGDLSRKACVDLLSLELPGGTRDRLAAADNSRAATSSGAPAPPAATAEAILRAFDRLEQQEAQKLESLRRSMPADEASAT